jgi:uracil-DNA glycosylase family 4
MKPETRTKLEAWLDYYTELGVSPFYLDRDAPAIPAAAPAESPLTAAAAAAASSVTSAAPPAESAVRPVAAAPLPVVAASPSLFERLERVEGDTLERIAAELDGCTRCKLHRGRRNIVFGVGNSRAELVFVGEGPGHDEDVQGEPFVGRAGKLLTQMIEAMGLRRADVYICNVVKCRPPENRTPEKDEIATCSPFLLRQLAAIQPKVIICLGGVAAQTLLGTNQPISRYRGQWFDFRGARLLATYHPAYLLRNPNAKGEVWKDLLKAMAVLGLKPPARRRT